MKNIKNGTAKAKTPFGQTIIDKAKEIIDKKEVKEEERGKTR